MRKSLLLCVIGACAAGLFLLFFRDGHVSRLKGQPTGTIVHVDSEPAIRPSAKAKKIAPDDNDALASDDQFLKRLAEEKQYENGHGTEQQLFGESYAVTQERAEAGDGAAAWRLIEGMRRCGQREGLKSKLAMVERLSTNRPETQAVEVRLKQKTRKAIAWLDSACQSVPRPEVGDLWRWQVMAANSGIPEAERALVTKPLLSQSDYSQRTAWWQEYETTMPGILQQRIEAGDATVISALISAWQDASDQVALDQRSLPALSVAAPVDPYRWYVYYLALRLAGAPGYLGVSGDKALASLRQKLNASQIASAEAEARRLASIIDPATFRR